MFLSFLCFAECLVVHAVESTFVSMLTTSDRPVVVAFSEDQSPAGLRLLKRWSAIESDFADDKRIILSQVSCSKQRKICDALRVRYIPLVACLRNDGIRIEYAGPREYDNLKAWVEHMAEPAVSNVSHLSDELLTGNKDYVTFVLSQPELLNEFETVAGQYKNTSNKFIFSEGALDSSLVAFMRSDFRDNFEISRDGSIQNFIWSHQFPLGFEITKFNYLEAVRSGRILAMLIVNPAMSGNNKRLNDFISAARPFHDKFAFGRIDGITYGDFIQSLDISSYPSVAFIDDAMERHLVLSFDASKFQEQLTGIVNGTIAFHKFSAWKKWSYIGKGWVIQRWPVLLLLIGLFSIMALTLYQLVLICRENVSLGVSWRDIFGISPSAKGYKKLD